MKIKKIISFSILFLMLFGFSYVSLGLANTQTDLEVAIQDLRSDPGVSTDTNTYVTVLEEVFDTKVLRFLKQEKVCALTNQQAQDLADVYSIENKEFDVDGNSVRVLYIEGNPINKDIIEGVLGETLGESCQVVHGNKVVAIISPIFVS